MILQVRVGQETFSPLPSQTSVTQVLPLWQGEKRGPCVWPIRSSWWLLPPSCRSSFCWPLLTKPFPMTITDLLMSPRFFFYDCPLSILCCRNGPRKISLLYISWDLSCSLLWGCCIQGNCIYLVSWMQEWDFAVKEWGHGASFEKTVATAIFLCRCWKRPQQLDAKHRCNMRLPLLGGSSQLGSVLYSNPTSISHLDHLKKLPQPITLGDL